MKSKEDFCQKVRQNENAMYALALSVLKNECDTADAVGETILRAYCTIDQLKNPDAFKPWILKILYHTCVEMLRKRPPSVDIEQQYDLADNATDISTKFVLREAVSRLPQPYQSVVTLYYYEGLTTGEIAGVTGRSVVAVKKQLSRARAMLRKTLKKEDLF